MRWNKIEEEDRWNYTMVVRLSDLATSSYGGVQLKQRGQ